MVLFPTFLFFIIGNETTVHFLPGEATKTVTVNILGDTLPERDESFTAYISNSTGGAILSNDTNVTVVILTNDNAAGTVSLAPESRAASFSEGSIVRLTVDRTVSQLGRLMVNWTITGTVNSTNNNFNFNNFTNQSFANQSNMVIPSGPESQFQTASSFIIFEEVCYCYTIYGN